MVQVTSAELHNKPGHVIDQAQQQPVFVTKHERLHAVVLSAELFHFMHSTIQKARRTGTLTPAERALAAQIEAPSDAEQKRFLAQLDTALNSPHP